MMVNTAECSINCKYGSRIIDGKNISVACSEKDKTYCYGQRLDCDYFTKKEKEDE